MSRRHFEQIHEVIREMRTADNAHGKRESLVETSTRDQRKVWEPMQGLALLVIVEVPTKSFAVPTSWGVNLVVAGAQVALPTKQPDVLTLPSQSKAN